MGWGGSWAKGFRDRGTPGAAPPSLGQGRAVSNLTISCLRSPHLSVESCLNLAPGGNGGGGSRRVLSEARAQLPV